MSDDQTKTKPTPIAKGAVDANDDGNGGAAEMATRQSMTEFENDAGGPDFSIGPNAEYYKPRPDDVYARLHGFIETSRGGVFGVTGVRGAGKSGVGRWTRSKRRTRDSSSSDIGAWAP